jgi:hypothetical protein
MTNYEFSPQNLPTGIGLGRSHYARKSRRLWQNKAMCLPVRRKLHKIRAVLQIDNTTLLQALHDRLEKIEHGEVPGFRAEFSASILKNAGIQRPGIPLTKWPWTIPPTANQRRFVEIALGNEVSWLFGPPGTGKSICNLVSATFYKDRLRTHLGRKSPAFAEAEILKNRLTIIDTSRIWPFTTRNIFNSRLNLMHALAVRNLLLHLRDKDRITDSKGIFVAFCSNSRSFPMLSVPSCSKRLIPQSAVRTPHLNDS